MKKEKKGVVKKRKLTCMDETKPYIDVNHEIYQVHKTLFMDRPKNHKCPLIDEI